MEKEKIFLLEDGESRIRLFNLIYKNDDVDATSDVKEAELLLSQNLYDSIFLDYDLGNGRNGMEICGILPWYQTKNVKIYLHSSDPDARAKMRDSLVKVGFLNVKEISFEEIVRLKNE